MGCFGRLGNDGGLYVDIVIDLELQSLEYSSEKLSALSFRGG